MLLSSVECPANRRVNLYCIHKPHSSRTVKSTMTATTATLAIVFMASPYIARRRLKKKPRTGGAGLLRFLWGEHVMGGSPSLLLN